MTEIESCNNAESRTLVEFVDIRTIGTAGKGQLSFFEAEKDIPFSIKRVYYIYGAPRDVQRGGHAHRKLDQLLICPEGEIEITLDDGEMRESVMLNDPSKGLMVRRMIWHDMVWRDEASILFVVASDYYAESDYIRDYSQFLEEVSANDASAVR